MAGEKRTIMKFDANGIPYEMETEIPGVAPLRRALTDAADNDRNPLIVVGDICGMGRLNNEFGREIADACILAALRAFVEQFAGNGAAAGSPSGDEIWAVAHPGATPESIRVNLKNYLEEIQTLDLEPAGLGLNARFLIAQGVDVFQDGEEKLKYKGDYKLPPGTIRDDVTNQLITSEQNGLSKQELIIRG